MRDNITYSLLAAAFGALGHLGKLVVVLGLDGGDAVLELGLPHLLDVRLHGLEVGQQGAQLLDFLNTEIIVFVLNYY